MTHKEIANLVHQIAQYDDEKAFAALFRHYFAALTSFGSSIVKNHEAVEDIVEDVFLKLWENRSMLMAVNNISNYIYVATKNACLNYLKSKRNQVQETIGETHLFSDNNPESTLVNHENVNAIIRLINELPPRCRLIFKLIKDDEMSYAEVAQLLNISVRTVNAQMTIATSKMIEGLKLALPELKSYYLKKKVF